MKRIILLLSFVFALTINAQSLNPVSENYSRIFRIGRMMIDYNQNGHGDKREFFNIKRDTECYFSIDYKEYLSEGNFLTLCFEAVRKRVINYENVEFYSDIYGNFTTYTIYNNMGEMIMMLVRDNSNMECTLSVYDLQLIK